MGDGGLPLLRSPLSNSSSRRGNSIDDDADLTTRDETLFENPQFEHYEETSNIQLFFDLFFVANLSSFTSAHEINSGHKLRSYIGFFCILWFSWCQVTLYDVRFATDSVFERVAHACHFGTMVGLSVVGPQFLNNNAWGPLQQLALILMASRAILFCQYGATLFFTWRYRTTRTPMIVMMGSLLVTCLLYLGVSIAFYERTAHKAYVAFYVIAVVEVLVNLAVAFWWKPMTFEKTHLVERMTCLTLIILGEGIMVLAQTIVKIQTLDLRYSSPVIGSLISAVLIIYFVYQLYFDNVHLEHSGSGRQQLWAGLHFPFHLALVLMMEGQNEILLWAHVIEDINNILYPFLDPNLQSVKLLDKVSSTVDHIFSIFPYKQKDFEDAHNAMGEILHPSPDATESSLFSASITVLGQMLKTVVEGFGWNIPPEQDTDDFIEYANSVKSVFTLTFAYFAIATGAVLLFIGVLTLLAYRHDPRHSFLRYVSISINMLVGLGIALLSTLVLTNAASYLGETPWTLPSLMLILLFLLAFHHLSMRKDASNKFEVLKEGEEIDMKSYR